MPSHGRWAAVRDDLDLWDALAPRLAASALRHDLLVALGLSLLLAPLGLLDARLLPLALAPPVLASLRALILLARLRAVRQVLACSLAVTAR